MNCIGFPKMFNANSTIVKTGLDATKTCVHLLLSSEQGQLFGDPDFGVRIKRFAFEQNNYILRDIIIDELFSKLTIFCPQLYLERKDITIEQSGSKLYANIKAINRVDFTTSIYNIELLNYEER